MIQFIKKSFAFIRHVEFKERIFIYANGIVKLFIQLFYFFKEGFSDFLLIEEINTARIDLISIEVMYVHFFLWRDYYLFTSIQFRQLLG
jgi:hypothetical protein